MTIDIKRKKILSLITKLWNKHPDWNYYQLSKHIPIFIDEDFIIERLQEQLKK